MDVTLQMIKGASIGAEYVSGETEDDYENNFIIDLFVVRLIIHWPMAE